jgi:hypothetical protein
MAHYAKVVNNIVTEVIVAEQDFIDTLSDKQNWIQTSYNTRKNQHLLGGTTLRGNFAGIGHTYDPTHDVFYPKKPYPSWIISALTNWEWTPPVAKPADGHIYDWDEANQVWVFAY